MTGAAFLAAIGLDFFRGGGVPPHRYEPVGLRGRHTNEPIDLSLLMCLDGSGYGCNKAAELVWTHTTTEGTIGIHGWCREHAPTPHRNAGDPASR